MTHKIIGANDRIRLGFIGVANRGGQLMTAFLKHDDMRRRTSTSKSRSRSRSMKAGAWSRRPGARSGW